MICWINFLNNRAHALLLALFLLAGCAQPLPEPLAEEEKPQSQPLTLLGLDVTRQGPETARLGALHCSVRTGGGEGDLTFAFRIVKQGIETIEYSGEEATWDWSPKEPGIYQVKATVADEAGIIVDSGWSSEYRFDPAV